MAPTNCYPCGSSSPCGIGRLGTKFSPKAWTGCASVAPRSPDAHQAADSRDDPKLCAWCEATKATKVGFCKTYLDTKKLSCARCDIGKKIDTKTLHHFSPEEVRRRKRTRELRRLRCKACEATPAAATAKQGICIQCDKAVSVSHLRMHTAATNAGVCRACRAKNEKAPKTCVQCAQPLHANAAPGAWCSDCAYPKCNGCGVAERPGRNAKYHAKNKPEWTCQACFAKKCLQCGAVPGKYQNWCVECVFPPCSGGCGQARPNKNPDYHARSQPEWYCHQCRDGYPPCPGCGTARPDDRAYHVTKMPEWTCQNCQPKACSQCGAAMHGKAAAGTWCNACAYPPCAGCGAERPTSKGYHARVMPEWACPSCAIKCCATCGKVLGRKTRSGAQCLDCSFPPCSAGCGAQRPAQSSYYRVQNLPIWVCPKCLATNHGDQPFETLAAAVPKRRRLNGDDTV